MYLTAKFVYKSGFSFVTRVAEVDREDFITSLFRNYHEAIKEYNILDDILDYVELENYYSYIGAKY